MEEYFFDCPYCWVKISMLLDVSVHQQSYIEIEEELFSHS